LNFSDLTVSFKIIWLFIYQLLMWCFFIPVTKYRFKKSGQIFRYRSIFSTPWIC